MELIVNVSDLAAYSEQVFEIALFETKSALWRLYTVQDLIGSRV